MTKNRKHIIEIIQALNKVLSLYGYEEIQIKNKQTSTLLVEFGDNIDQFVDDGFEYALPEELIIYYNKLFDTEGEEDLSVQKKALSLLSKDSQVGVALKSTVPKTLYEILEERRQNDANSKLQPRPKGYKTFAREIMDIIVRQPYKTSSDIADELHLKYPNKERKQLLFSIYLSMTYARALLGALTDLKLEEGIKRLNKKES